ncbi:MAG: aminotransferase class III-fold pyridoxal phosphate-dependent enzyme [Pseudonocardiaceae bacterium]
MATNLARIAPGDLDVVQLCCTGSEAVEAALKLAERVQGPRRSMVAYASQSFHGKTRGALSVTDSARYRSRFRLVSGGVGYRSGTSRHWPMHCAGIGGSGR